jgi:hypothetical protein
MREGLTSAERVLLAVERWLPTAEARYATMGDNLDLTDRVLIMAARGHWKSGTGALPVAERKPRAWDADNPGCAPEACGGSRLDPCDTVMRTRGAEHDGERDPEPVQRTWKEACAEDMAKGADGKFYPVTRAAAGTGPNEGFTVVTLDLDNGDVPRTFQMRPDDAVTLIRGEAGRAADALRGAGLGPEVIRS